MSTRGGGFLDDISRNPCSPPRGTQPTAFFGGVFRTRIAHPVWTKASRRISSLVSGAEVRKKVRTPERCPSMVRGSPERGETRRTADATPGRSVLLRCAKKAVDHHANGGHNQGQADCLLSVECAGDPGSPEDEGENSSDPYSRQAVAVAVAYRELLERLVLLFQAVPIGLFSFRKLEKPFRHAGQDRFLLLQHLWMR